jgi:type I restriction enzyme S subunit
LRDNRDFMFQRHIAYLRPNTEVIDPGFLCYALNSSVCKQQADAAARGVAQKTVTLGSLRSFTLPLAPLPEQRRIVARIDELFAEITEGEGALERARQGLDTWRRALHKAAVTGELTRDWREANRPTETGADLLARIRAEREGVVVSPGRRNRSPNASNLDAASLPGLPDGWVHAPFGDFVAKIEAGLNVKALGRPPDIDEIGIVKVSAVTWGEFDELASKTLPPKAVFDEADMISQGDFLFSRANTLELVGAPVIVKHCVRRLVLSDKVLRIRLVGGIDRWIEIFLKSPYGRAQIEAFSTGNQLSMRNISQENIKRIMIPLPPEKELQELLKVYDLMEGAGAEAAEGTSRLGDTEKALRQSILKAAFEGRLVPQDPAVEPASALLALRNGHPGNGARRRRARAAADISHPLLPVLTLSVDPRVMNE